MFKRIVIYFTWILLIAPTGAFCSTFGLDLFLNGFGTICGSKSDLPKYDYFNLPAYPFATQLGTVAPYVASVQYAPAYAGAARRWSFTPNSKFGLQFAAIFNDKFKAVTQLVGGYEFFNDHYFYVQMDWAYLQYNFSNDLDFQMGHFRLPTYYFSDYLDVNHAQPWVSPPEEVYFIVGDAFSNADGIKATYSYYFQDWFATTKLWYASMDDQLSILTQKIDVNVRDVIGGNLQLGNDRFSIQGSLMRSIYNTDLYGSLQGLVSATQALNGAPFQAATNLQSVLRQKDVPIIYVGLAFNAKITDNIEILMERASLLSRGIISTARQGWYGSLIYSLDKYAFALTYGFSRPLQTEINKYNAVRDFFTSTPYLTHVDMSSGAGNAAISMFQSYLGSQRSLGLDARYDILPSVSLKGQIKYIRPVDQKGMIQKYILNLIPTNQHILVYRISLDFVF